MPGSGVPGSGVPGSGGPGSGVPVSGTPGSGVSGSGTPGSGTPRSGSPSHVLALDVGGTGIKAGLVDRDGKLVHATRRATGAERGPEAVIETILSFAAELAGEAARRGTPVAAAGIALPGILDEAAGVGVWSATLGWRDVPFRALLTDRLDLPVAIGHDVRAGGLAEARIGAGRGSSRFLFLPLGTSIGGAVMVDGRASLGPHGIGGEFGHIVVRPGGIPCECGLAGCLAQYSSAGAVVKRYREAVGAGDGSGAAPGGAYADAIGAASADGAIGAGDAAGDRPAGTAVIADSAAAPVTDAPTHVTGALDVALRLAAGDPIAARVWAEAVDALSDALLTAAALLDPDRVVVGGGLAECGDLLMRPLAAALAAKATFHALPDLVSAELGDLAGCLGAGLLGWDLVDGDLAGEDPAGEDPADEDPADEDPAGEDPADEDPAGEDPAGEDPAGEDPAGENPAGENPASGDPIGEDPVP